MASKKFYAVKCGKVPGIYTSWEQCKAQTDGFSGAVYKSFTSLEEAKAYIKADSSVKPLAAEDYIAYTLANPAIAIAYVDGSYNIHTTEFGSGVVMFVAGKELHFSQGFSDSELAAMRNVAGEIKAAEIAMNFAFNNNISELYIYHDYEGISKWCLKEWKAGKAGTIHYQQLYDRISQSVKINFVKVKGHSNDTYNDIADQLAKASIGVE